MRGIGDEEVQARQVKREQELGKKKKKQGAL